MRKSILTFSMVVIAILTLLTSCATSRKINNISAGMTKEQVIQRMGKPSSTSSDGYYEYLRYQLSETSDDAFYGHYTTYFVRLLNGKVESYGKMGDFNSTKNQTIDINTNNKYENKTDNKTDKMYEELTKLKDLLDKGIITKEEYEKKKKEILDKY